MAAPVAHHSQDNSTPLDLQHPLVPPQAYRADRPSASPSTGPGGTSEHAPPPPLSPRKLSRIRNHSSRHVFVPSNAIGDQDTGGLVVVRGEPVTMEELRWERAKFIERRTRRWRTIKEGLGLIILSWTIYQTVRYFVAYKGELSPLVGGRSLTLVNTSRCVSFQHTTKTSFEPVSLLHWGFYLVSAQPYLSYARFLITWCVLWTWPTSDTDSAPHHCSASRPDTHQMVPVLHRLSLLHLHSRNSRCQRYSSS
jgi:hypothetical protein